MRPGEHINSVYDTAVADSSSDGLEDAAVVDGFVFVVTDILHPVSISAANPISKTDFLVIMIFCFSCSVLLRLNDIKELCVLKARYTLQ